MSALLTSAEVATYLGITDPTAAQLALLETLIDQTEVAFLAACRRSDMPFQAAETGRVELHDGTGTSLLWLDYPISDVTSLTLGADLSDLDETLEVDNTDELIWTAGKRRVVRSDGGIFGQSWQARYVRVVYDAAADLPNDAKNAVKLTVAALYQRMGSEGLVSERDGAYEAVFAELMAGNGSITTGDPIWRAAVAAHLEVHV